MNDRLLSAISLCRKAGKLRMGSDVVKEEVQGGRAALVLMACDLAERSVRQAEFVCGQNNTPVLRLSLTMEQLWQVVGKRYGVFAVCDRGFAKMIAGLVPPDEPEK